jgi:hypothetical protein
VNSGGTHRALRPAAPRPTLLPRDERHRPVVLRYAAPPRPARRRRPGATAVMTGAVAVVCAFVAVVLAGAWTGIALLHWQAMTLDARAPGDHTESGEAAPVAPAPVPPSAAEPRATDPGRTDTTSVDRPTLLTAGEQAVVEGQGPPPPPAGPASPARGSQRSALSPITAPPSPAVPSAPPADVPSAPLAAPMAPTPALPEGSAAAASPTGRPSGASPARTPQHDCGSSHGNAVPGAGRPAPPAEATSADRPRP